MSAPRRGPAVTSAFGDNSAGDSPDRAKVPASYPATAPGPTRVGILGCGNMGGALAKGVAALPAYALHVYDSSGDRMRDMADLGAAICSSPVHLAASVDLLVLALKPEHMPGALAETAAAFLAVPDPGKALVSIAAGVTLEQLERGLRAGLCVPAAGESSETTAGAAPEVMPVARVMPNTLLMAGEGLFGLCLPGFLPPEAAAAVRGLLSALGRVVELPESKMNAFTALAGCGPAYAFYFAESLAEAGVSMGLSRADSLDIAFSLLRGAPALAQKTGLHPSLLREQVTSPGGVTIAATNHLDRAAVRGSIVDAVLAAYARGRDMERGT